MTRPRISEPRPDPDRPAYPDITVQLTGRDGNAYAIIGAVARELRRQVGDAAATAFAAAAFECGSYDELLQLAMATVTVD
jgi:hypothetical protein